MAELITWSDKYSVNNSLMDSQHKKLIALINELNSAMKEGKGKLILHKIFDELINYTKYHFSNEEYLMKKADYPGLIEHQQIHKDLTKQVIDLQEKYLTDSNLVTFETMNFLKNWLLNHIEGTDKKYSKFIS